MGADLIVEVALRHDRSEWARVVPDLCGGDAELEALVRALLAHYDRPDAPLPDGPYPCTVGPFTLERELGAGAHGKVYLARRPPLDGFVALKLLRPGPGMTEFVEQVRREAGRARRIPSAHVVPVFDAGRIDGGPFYVEMAVCADPDEEAPGSIRIGRSLRDAQPGLAAAEAARLVEDLAGAVHAAHRTGIVHGDVKPENVLLTPETHRVMLADFGIATSLAVSVAAGSTPIGTVAYMAPEQWRDRLAPSPASDVYTLGGTLYYLLSGVAPHADREAGADAPPPPLPATVPPRLREIVQRALAPRPEDRPPSAAALADELRRFRALQPTWHDRRSVPRRALLFARRHARELSAVAAVLAVLLPLVVAGYRFLAGRVGELAAREATLRGRIQDLDRSRADLERDIAKLEGAADSKQKELARTESRLQQLPRLEQALGAAKEDAAKAEAALARRDAEARDSELRAAGLEAQVAAVREALVDAQSREHSAREDAATREAAARVDAGHALGERDEARRRLSDAEVRLRALEKDLRDREAALAAARAVVEQQTARSAAAERERDAARRERAPAPAGGKPPTP